MNPVWLLYKAVFPFPQLILSFRKKRDDDRWVIIEKGPKPHTTKLEEKSENAAYVEKVRTSEDLSRMSDVKFYEAVHSRTGNNSKELTVLKGDILQVLDSSRNWWKLRNHKEEVGYVPYTILKPVKTDVILTSEGGVLLSYLYGSDHSFDDNSSKRSASRRDDLK